MSIVLYSWFVSYFCCLFSYHSLLELHSGDRMHKSQTTMEQAIEVGLSFREAEWRLDTELFLDEYPRWELGAPHWSVILHEMFYMPLSEGRRSQRGSSAEAAGAACQGLTQRWTNLPWNLWDTRLLIRRSGTLMLGHPGKVTSSWAL